MAKREKFIAKFQNETVKNILAIFLLYGVKKRIINLFPRHSLMNNLATLLLANKFPIFISYPIDPKPRFGWKGKEDHKLLTEIVSKFDSNYDEFVGKILNYSANYSSIQLRVDSNSLEPEWIQNMFPPMDASSLYTMLVELNPRNYIEIGSGNSTRFTRRAIIDHNLQTKVTSIDPYPRRDIDSICDTVIRKPLEEVELGIFDKLDAGDILFIDNSHCAFTNSDVTISFLEIIPRLSKGVIIHIHDIFLPRDYPVQWSDRWYSEQYLLACSLLTGNNFEILFANNYVHFSQLSERLKPLWINLKLKDSEVNGVHDGTGPTSFWMKKV